MTQLNVTNARCAALFASQLQRSDTPAPDVVKNHQPGQSRGQYPIPDVPTGTTCGAVP